MARRRPGSMRGLEALGRERLSRFFFMRDFLYSETANFHALPNIPSDPDLALAAGRELCTQLLDPIVETFGPIHLRSSFRAAEVNDYGARNGLNCAANEANFAGHIWDRRDANGRMGATACIVVPWFAARYEDGRDLADLAWWVHDHLPYAAMEFFPRLAAFNLTWHEAAPGHEGATGELGGGEPDARPRRIFSWTHSPRVLFKDGDATRDAPPDRAERYGDFPPFRGLADVLPR